jgi:hypothetical protein
LDEAASGIRRASVRFCLGPLAILILALAAWVALRQVDRSARVDLRQGLTTVLSTTQQALRTWAKQERHAASTWASHQAVVDMAAALSAISGDRAALLGAEAQRHLRDFLSGVMAARGDEGYFVIGTGNLNLASSRDANVGVTNLLVRHPDQLERLWSGQTAISYPLASDVPLTDSTGTLRAGRATMFVGAPIGNHSGTPIALLVFRVNPYHEWANLLRRGRIGQTG